MKAPLYFALACLLTACGPELNPRGEVITRCDVHGWGAFEFEHKANCQFVIELVEVAREVMDERGIVERDAFYREFAGTPVHVRFAWEVAPQARGHFDIGAGIDLEVTMKSLVHELCHAFDAHRFGLLTFTHDGWDRNGYDAAGAEFEARWPRTYGAPPARQIL